MTFNLGLSPLVNCGLSWIPSDTPEIAPRALQPLGVLARGGIRESAGTSTAGVANRGPCRENSGVGNRTHTASMNSDTSPRTANPRGLFVMVKPGRRTSHPKTLIQQRLPSRHRRQSQHCTIPAIGIKTPVTLLNFATGTALGGPNTLTQRSSPPRVQQPRRQWLPLDQGWH